MRKVVGDIGITARRNMRNDADNDRVGRLLGEPAPNQILTMASPLASSLRRGVIICRCMLMTAVMHAYEIGASRNALKRKWPRREVARPCAWRIDCRSGENIYW